MSSQTTRVARVNRPEWIDLPAHWTSADRGQYLRLLLQLKGIDPNRLYRIAYHPQARCWLLTQEAEPEPAPGRADTPAIRAEAFYRETLAQFRWVAHTACASLAARSLHFARFGCEYQLPPQAEEITPADLARWLGGPSSTGGAPADFNSEGGWHGDPSDP